MENKIVFPEEMVTKHVRDAYARLKFLVEFRGYTNVHLDFSSTKIAFAQVILPIAAACENYRQDGIRFELTLPNHQKLSKLFVNSNWAHYICPKLFPQSNYVGSYNIPSTRFRDYDEQYRAVSSIIERVLRTAQFLERSNLRALEWSLNEITDNVLTHSNADIGGFVQLSIHHHSKEIEYVVVDPGIGIPESLRQGLRNNWSDKQALEEAVKEGVTRGTGQGNGLYGSANIAAVSGGSIAINSGVAYLNLMRSGATFIRDDEVIYPGTSVVCAINYARPLVLERALNFKGQAYVPVDSIELQYEEEDTLRFVLARETHSTGSRFAGASVRNKLEKLIQYKAYKGVIVDAAGAGLMSSSFADEFLAKLVVKFGADVFRRMFRLENFGEVNMGIATRSARQRLGDESFSL